MITIEQAQQLIEKNQKVYSPTDKKRLVVPAYGFSGAVDAKRVDWLPPTYEAKEYDVKGFVFYNPKDDAKQVLKQEDGCFIMYDAPGLKAKVDEYINEGMDHMEAMKKVAADLGVSKRDIYRKLISIFQILLPKNRKHIRVRLIILCISIKFHLMMVTMIIMSSRNCLNRTVLSVRLAWLLKCKRFLKEMLFLQLTRLNPLFIRN